MRCKVTVKDARKPVSNKPVACQHKWVKHCVKETVTYDALRCACGQIFENSQDWQKHRVEAGMNREYGHGSCFETPITKTITKCDYEYCEKCGVRK